MFASLWYRIRHLLAYRRVSRHLRAQLAHAAAGERLIAESCWDDLADEMTDVERERDRCLQALEEVRGEIARARLALFHGDREDALRVLKDADDRAWRTLALVA